MRSSSLGKQRANRRSHRNGAVCRFRAALAATVALGFGVGAPLAAARAPAQLGLDDGHAGASSGRSDVVQSDGSGEHLRAQLERFLHRLLAEIRKLPPQAAGGPPQPPEIQIPRTTLPPVTIPTEPPVPVTTPTPNQASARLPAPNGVGALGAASTAPRTGASGGVAALSTANGRAVGAAPTQQAPTPPAAAPATTPRSGSVARALRTARSYGALLALAAVVVIFLLVQGRVDRRDPRILSAPAEDQLPFRDFE